MDRVLCWTRTRSICSAVRLVAYACVIAGSLSAQLITNTSAIPRTGDKPPVVFVNGYQSGCNNVTFAGTFGTADQVLQSDGRVSLFFDNCTIGGNSTPIEELGNGLKLFLDGLRYQDGQPVPQVDIVAHSMGGLIVRSYLAGKQVDDGVFTPPMPVPIRKIVFIATPHFGTPIGSQGNDRQTEQLAVASQFTFDLGTWNQGLDQLRGTDAIAILGNAGNDAVRILGVDWPTAFHDSTVSLMSGSLGFALLDRTRILPFCHTSGIAQLACTGGVPRLADITSDQHLSAQIILSFLNNTQQWRTIGQSPSDNTFLRDQAGIALRWRDANDRLMNISAAALRPQGSTAQFANLPVRSNTTAYDELLPANAYDIRLTASDSTTLNAAYQPSAGAVRAVTFKNGPNVAAAIPVFSSAFPRAVAPGMFVSIYGSALSTQTEAAPTLPYPTTLAATEVRIGDRALPLHYVSPQQINTVMPEDISGLIKLTVRGASGQHTINVLVEPAVPSVFESAVKGSTVVTAAAPASPGDFITLYLTGLGTTERRADGLDWARQQPEVTIGNQACALQFAGRTPGYIGLDQVNCRIPIEAATGDLPLTVRSGNRVSNTITVPVR